MNQLYVEIALGGSILADPASIAGLFADVSPYVISIKTKRGKMHELNRTEAGTATIKVLNTNGWFWRYNTTSPLYPNFKPLVPIRIRKTYDGNSTTYPVFYGMIESIVPGWVDNMGAGRVPIVTINCVDLFKAISKNIIPYGTNFSPELSGTRVLNVLNAIAAQAGIGSWPAGLVNIGANYVQVSGLTPPADGTNAMEHLYSVAAAEMGTIFVSVDGKVTFQGKNSRFTTFGTSQATFDANDSNPYVSPDMQDDDTFIYNTALVNYNGGAAPIEWQDLTYATNQGLRIYQDANLGASGTTAIIQNYNDAWDLAYTTVERYVDTKLRAVALNIIPDSKPAVLYPEVLSYDISTRITLNLNNNDNPSAIPNKQYHIEAIDHAWDASDDTWSTSWQLWDVNQYMIVHNIRTSLSGLQNNGISYTTVHNASTAANAYNWTSTGAINVGQATALGPQVDRGLIVLDTSAIPASPSLESASLFLYTAGSNDGETLCLVLHGTVNYPVAVSDYGALLGQTAIMGSATVSSGVSGLIQIPLNTLGTSAIVPGGTTIFALRSLDDINATAPTGDQMMILTASTDAYLAVQFNL